MAQQIHFHIQSAVWPRWHMCEVCMHPALLFSDLADAAEKNEKSCRWPERWTGMFHLNNMPVCHWSYWTKCSSEDLWSNDRDEHIMLICKYTKTTTFFPPLMCLPHCHTWILIKSSSLTDTAAWPVGRQDVLCHIHYVNWVGHIQHPPNNLHFDQGQCRGLLPASIQLLTVSSPLSTMYGTR